MNQSVPWILISIATLLILFGVIYLLYKKKKTPDYYSLFLIGVVWLVIGIPLQNYVLSAIGMILMTVGLANKKKWQKRKKWNELNPKEKNAKIIIMIILFVLFIVGLIFFFLTEKGLI